MHRNKLLPVNCAPVPLNVDEDIVDDVNTLIEESESESGDGKRSEDSEANEDEDEHRTRPIRMRKRPDVYDPSRYA